ncbi:MAG: arylsulfatase, partial [Prevotella sp.]|nr:arylsulfatase [Prevotella sp.]
MKKKEISKGMKIGFVYLMLANLLFAIQLFSFMNGIVASVMDFTGWLFFIASCVSHAACLALIPF